MIKKGISFFLLLSIFSLHLVAQKNVVLDNYYNNETDPKTGLQRHYIWEDKTLGGFSEFGDLFIENGANLNSLKEKPNSNNLKDASIFIIVDPDTPKETSKPNYMDAQAAAAIAKWVKKGGVLLLLTNDYTNCELDSFNILMKHFGMMYNKELLHPELKAPKGMPRNYNSCACTDLPNHPLFNGASKIFLKEVASIACSKPAKPVLKDKDQVLIAEAKYGKGYVLAVGDPWLYNEYIDHAHLPADFENLKAAKNLVKLLLKKAKCKSTR